MLDLHRVVLVCLPLFGGTVFGGTVEHSELGTGAAENACSLSKTATEFEPSVRQIFHRIVLRSVRSSDRLQIEWVNPEGRIVATAPFDQLPAASSLCLLSQLPVGGFEAASQPGIWRVRATWNGRIAREDSFRILPDTSGGLRITGLSRQDARDGRTRISLEVAGAHSETTVNLAQYTDAGGWNYLAHFLPERFDGRSIALDVPHLPPAEYVIILRNPDGRQSAPARFLISTDSGYRLPTPAGYRWVVTQGPYGAYSHWGRAVHAYDIAPSGEGGKAARWVVAMRPGVVHAFDLGLGQTPHRRIFGNYITLRHDDGEFSHYAHLKTGSFLVSTGQRVEAGQPLAQVGTSGFSFGVHVHVQVTRALSISSPSIPFRFEDLPSAKPRGTVISRNSAPASASNSRWSASVPFAGWWSNILKVPPGSKSLQIQLGWEDQNAEFDLYVVSPTGRQFNSSAARPENLAIPNPEAGSWRVSVQAVQGDGESLPFWVGHSITPGREP